MRKTLLGLLFLLAAAHALSVRAQYPPPPPYPPQEAYARSAAVFVGRVRGAGQTFAMTRMGRVTACVVTRPTTFTVVRSYYGAHAEEVTLGDAYTSFNFAEGEAYLVYAYLDTQTGGLVTSERMRTRPLAEAGEDLRFLDGESAARTSGVSFGGSVTRKNRPLAGVRVELSGDGRRQEARTDARGEYLFAGLAPGRYRVRVRPRWTLVAVEPERLVAVSDRGSVREDFVLRSSILWFH